MRNRLVAVVFFAGSLALAQEAPKIVSLEPSNAAEVDAKTTKRLVVTFDRPMAKGFSLCGGGPQFPKVKGAAKWQDEKTLVAEIELEPDHEYQLAVNCPAAQNTR